MKNYVQRGETVTFTAPAGGTVSGNAYLVGAMLVIAHTDAAAGDDCEGLTCGVVTLPKKTADTPAQFANAYWDDTNKEITTNNTGTKKVGVFMKAYGSTDTEAEVRLNGISV